VDIGLDRVVDRRDIQAGLEADPVAMDLEALADILPGDLVAMDLEGLADSPREVLAAMDLVVPVDIHPAVPADMGLEVLVDNHQEGHNRHTGADQKDKEAAACRMCPPEVLEAFRMKGALVHIRYSVVDMIAGVGWHGSHRQSEAWDPNDRPRNWVCYAGGFGFDNRSWGSGVRSLVNQVAEMLPDTTRRD